MIEKASSKTVVHPFFSIRDHFGPIFAITGNQLTTQANPLFENLIFTAGSEGIIRTWYIPNTK